MVQVQPMPRRIRHDLDLAWKEALTAYLPQFLELFLPEVHRDIDWGHPVEFLDGEVRRLNRGLSGQRRHADLVVRVHLLSGALAMVVIHVEVQSQKDNQMPLRMRLYSDRLFERHRCPIYSLLVLGDADPQWRPSLYESRIWGSIVLEFPTLYWGLATASELENSNALALVVAPPPCWRQPRAPARVPGPALCRLMHPTVWGKTLLDSSRAGGLMAMTDDRYREFNRRGCWKNWALITARNWRRRAWAGPGTGQNRDTQVHLKSRKPASTPRTRGFWRRSPTTAP